MTLILLCATCFCLGFCVGAWVVCSITEKHLK